MIKFQHVTFNYPHQETPVFLDFSLMLPQDQITVILGPNGCGKSTLFHLAYGWLQPSAGQLMLGNHALNKVSRNELGRQISILPQFEKAPFQFSVLDYVLLGRTPYHTFLSQPSEQDRLIASTSIKLLQIDHLLQKRVSQLSGGEQQLVFIARVLTQNTPLILLDEVTTHLDLNHIKTIFSRLKHLQIKGKTIVMTMHDPNLAAVIADEVVLMFPDGTAIQGKPLEIMTSKNLSRAFSMNVPLTGDTTRFQIDWFSLIEI